MQGQKRLTDDDKKRRAELQGAMATSEEILSVLALLSDADRGGPAHARLAVHRQLDQARVCHAELAVALNVLEAEHAVTHANRYRANQVGGIGL